MIAIFNTIMQELCNYIGSSCRCNIKCWGGDNTILRRQRQGLLLEGVCPSENKKHYSLACQNKFEVTHKSECKVCY